MAADDAAAAARQLLSTTATSPLLSSLCVYVFFDVTGEFRLDHRTTNGRTRTNANVTRAHPPSFWMEMGRMVERWSDIFSPHVAGDGYGMRDGESIYGMLKRFDEHLPGEKETTSWKLVAMCVAFLQTSGTPVGPYLRTYFAAQIADGLLTSTTDIPTMIAIVAMAGRGERRVSMPNTGDFFATDNVVQCQAIIRVPYNLTTGRVDYVWDPMQF